MRTEASELELDNAKLHILDGSNWLYSKWLAKRVGYTGKVLDLCTFLQAKDAENPLADMYYYSVPYYTDRISEMSQGNWSRQCSKEHLAQYNQLGRINQ